MKKVIVTGGSGRLGTQIIKELLEHNYEVVGVDRVRPEEALCKHFTINSGNLGEVYGVLEGADAVIHMAAIPSPTAHPNEVVFGNNVLSTYNILEAASVLGIKKAVIASSICAYGMVYCKEPFDPKYAPMDEEHPRLPKDAYALSKVVDETTAFSFHLKAGMQVVSMRFTAVITPERYDNFELVQESEESKRILWSYIDIRDAASACRLGIEADGLGALPLNIIDDYTNSTVPSMDLMKTHYPHVSDIRGSVEGFDTLVSNDKAKKTLNWQPVHHWRQYVK